MIQKDPEYEFVPPIPQNAYANQSGPKGRQCGECGMKFEYDKSYGYYCGSQRCPMGFR